MNETYNSKVWDQPIYEIKMGGVKDGLSFRRGQERTIGGTSFVISDIVRDEVDGEIMYMVFGTNLADKEDVRILKACVNIGVYITFGQ